MTKQYITIDMKAVEHITDPREQRERLSHIMSEVGSLLESLRSDQAPILPDYVSINQMDMQNVPDNSGFLDMINSDISAVLQVPRSAAGQERGSSFAATYTSSQWSIQAIARLQGVVRQGLQELFAKHLEMVGIVASKRDMPRLSFDPIDEESPYQLAQRATLGYRDGVYTLEEAREVLSLSPKPIGSIKDSPTSNQGNKEQFRPNEVDTKGTKPTIPTEGY